MTGDTPINLFFMLEEETAKDVLNVLLPQILPPPSCVQFFCIQHQGKDDLIQSIRFKLRGWRNPNDFFVILHDQDDRDCRELKRELRGLCAAEAQQHNPLIRIVCRELEAWYLGDLDATQKVFPQAAILRNKPKYRYPDSIRNPAKILKGKVKGFRKKQAAMEIPEHMNIHKNTSTSFNQMVTGVKDFVVKCLEAQENQT